MGSNDGFRVAVVGLGNLGGSVAANLAGRGNAVSGFDPDPLARQRAADAGVTACDDLASAISDAGAVITSLPDGQAVAQVWLGEDGIVARAKPGTFAIELSTTGPDTMLEVAGPAAAAGLRVVDCPVSGGPPEARTGDLVCIAGGDAADVEEIRPLLEQVGSQVLHAGPVGSAKTVKLVNNLMTNSAVLICAEAFQIGVAAGLEPRHLFGLLSQMGGGRIHHFQKRFPWALDGDFSSRFSVRLAEKDLRLGLDLGQWAGVPTPAVSLVRSVYAVAMAEGMADDDIVGMLQLYQRWTADDAPARRGQASA